MKKKIIAGSLIGTIVIALLIVNALFINPSEVKIREETIVSGKLSDKFDGFIIAYFADTHYGYTDTAQIKRAIEKINEFSPDVIIFGGDLIDEYAAGLDKEELVDLFSSLKADQAKFAVLGNHDLTGMDSEEFVTSVLEESGFRVLINDSAKVHLGKDDYINIVGIDSILNGAPDVETAYEKVDTSEYTLTVCHTPDIYSSLTSERSDYILSGHSHGGQIYIPLINMFTRPVGAKKYFKGKTSENGVTMDITNGVGVTHKSARLFADAEVVIYKLSAYN